GNQSVTATDIGTSSITGSATVTVNAANAKIGRASCRETATACNAVSITEKALDEFNNVATSYLGTVHFSKSDSGAGSAVPGDYTFLGGDNGVHTFSNGVTPVAAGNQSVTATDIGTSSITGSATVTVNAANA